MARLDVVFLMFQSTRPRGRTRRLLLFQNFPENGFQSTRPRGRTRPDAIPGKDFIIVSIHASSREDATYGIALSMLIALFQSTRPRGRTRLGIAAAGRNLSLFQSTRPRGRTRRYIKKR